MLCPQVDGVRGSVRESVRESQFCSRRVWKRVCEGSRDVSETRGGERDVSTRDPLPRSPPYKHGWDEGGRGPGAAGSRRGEDPVRGGVRQGHERRTGNVRVGSALGGLSDPMREVWVPDAVVAATRLGAEVSAGCVLCSWEQVRTRPLRASEEVTHGDKETPGDGPGEVRTPPWLGYSGAPEGAFRAPPRSLSPSPPASIVAYLAGTKCSQRSRDTGRSRNGCPVPTQQCVLGDWEPRPRAGWVRASLSVQEAQEAHPPLSHRCRGTPSLPAIGSGRRTPMAEPSPALRGEGACGLRRSGRRGGVATWRGEETSREQRCSAPLSAASPGLGRPGPSPFPRATAERSRKASRLSGAAAHPGPQCVRQVPGPWGDTCALMRKRVLELGLAL